ncbi:MAG: NADH:quinone oxidoreductase [Yoonia sp.]|nr:NADH:quinone oxidoreductase [Yoonia sp.]
MNETSRNIPRISFVAALFGILAAFVAGSALSYSIVGAILIGLVVAVIVWAILWLGWTDPQAAPQAPRAAAAAVATPIPSNASAKVAETAASIATVTAADVAPAAVTAMPAAEKAAKPAAAKSAKPAAEKTAKPAAADKPAVLAKARDGGPDDLKMIKGVGPVLEKALHENGVFHFDQVAAWKIKDARWFDENVKGANGRVIRDEWIKQAKILAKGGTTAFSNKVKKGGVY